MKQLIVIGVIGLIFCSMIRYISRKRDEKRDRNYNFIGILPDSRSEALLFAGQFASILEIFIGISYEKLNIDRYPSNQFVFGFLSQILCFSPIIVAILIAVLIVKFRKL
jgi:heme/copper-type cytochrome/quinol oxidase subunit 2